MHFSRPIPADFVQRTFGDLLRIYADALRIIRFVFRSTFADPDTICEDSKVVRHDLEQVIPRYIKDEAARTPALALFM